MPTLALFHDEVMAFFERKEAGDLTQARAVLALVPDRAPMEGDELPA